MLMKKKKLKNYENVFTVKYYDIKTKQLRWHVVDGSLGELGEELKK